MISRDMVRVQASTLLIVAFASACALNPKEDPTTYYVLSALSDDPSLWSAAGLHGTDVDEATRSAGPELQLRIGVGPITFPQYLERTRMVTRVAENELRFSEIHRWAQPLDDAFRATLARDIEFLLGTRSLILHPWYRTEAPEYTVRVEVTRFERDAEGTAQLTCMWEIRSGADQIFTSGVVQLLDPADDATVQASVAAQSRLIAVLSRTVADEIRKLAS